MNKNKEKEIESINSRPTGEDAIERGYYEDEDEFLCQDNEIFSRGETNMKTCKYFHHIGSQSNVPNGGLHIHQCTNTLNKTERCGWSITHGENPANCPLFQTINVIYCLYCNFKTFKLIKSDGTTVRRCLNPECRGDRF